MSKLHLPAIAAAVLWVCGAAQAAPSLMAVGSLSAQGSDLSGLTGVLENGQSASLLGGIGSGLAWAGGNTFLALPDRGPNAVVGYQGLDGVTANTVDDTASYVARFHTFEFGLTRSASGALPYELNMQLKGSTLLWSPTALNYGSTANLPSAVPGINLPARQYFTGRSDGFVPGLSTNPSNARLDPEAIRVSNDGRSVYIADEYGPYVYQFDRFTGGRTRAYALPGNLAIANLSSSKDAEIGGNVQGRVTNKGMEGLAITPDGRTLFGFMQSPLIQDGGDGARFNRIVSIDTVTGNTRQFAYDSRIGSKNYNSSEILALNDHQFLVLERDGKGLGDGSNAGLKQMRFVDLAGATDVGGLSGEASLAVAAKSSTLFLDLVSALAAAGYAPNQIPAKLEGATFGQDIIENGVVRHTLYVSNDNDFSTVAGDNKIFVFGFTDADLQQIKPGATLQLQDVAAVPEAGTWSMAAMGLALLAVMRRRQVRRG